MLHDILTYLFYYVIMYVCTYKNQYMFNVVFLMNKSGAQYTKDM